MLTKRLNSRRLNSTGLIIPQTKSEAIISKDVGGDRFQVKTHASRQIQDLGCYNFLPVAPMVTILVAFQKCILLPHSDL